MKQEATVSLLNKLSQHPTPKILSNESGDSYKGPKNRRRWTI